MTQRLLLLAAMLLGCATQAVGQPQDHVRLYQPQVFTNSSGATMPYRLYVPEGYKAKKKYPLILWLHGAAGRGTDNLKQITQGNAVAARAFISTAVQKKWPALVLAPQCPEGRVWANVQAGEMNPDLRLALEVLDAVRKQYNIDPDRVYVAGQSMGGFATWDLLARLPERFAAALPLCGRANASAAKNMKRVAIWAFHGEADETVPVTGSRDAITAIRAAGGEPKYSEYPGVGHNVWDKAFAEPDLFSWLFKQKRGK